MNPIIKKLKNELSRAVVGQEVMIDGLIMGLICDGHILIEGVPGLAKTTTINALSKAIGLESKRIQFTPDLLPSDIIGAEIYNPQNHTFSIKKGPLFTHLLLADEINRAPAKVQSALLEVMQERQVTIGDETFPISSPFLVMATQNPIEQEGVYPLPEAQLDRFMMKIIVSHNSQADELEIMRKSATKSFESIRAVISIEEIETLQKELIDIHVDKEIEIYMVKLISATREPTDNIMFGASPRASIDLYRASSARALLNNKKFVSPDDIASVLHSVLRHRIVLSYQARAKGVTTDEIITQILESVPIP
ncbi:MAG: MoxR family ATPase [Sulfurovum sp.]